MSSDTSICEDSVWEYKYNEDKWVSHPELSKHARKVGATALIRKDELLILGGYGNDSCFQLEHFMTRINLKTNELRYYQLVSKTKEDVPHCDTDTSVILSLISSGFGSLHFLTFWVFFASDSF